MFERVKATSQYKKLQEYGFELSSSPKQIEHGTFEVSSDVQFEDGSTKKISYQIMIDGSIRSNRFEVLQSTTRMSIDSSNKRSVSYIKSNIPISERLKIYTLSLYYVTKLLEKRFNWI